MKGPAIFLAQFLPPLGETITLQDMCKWAASLGYEGVQVPTWDKRIFDLQFPHFYVFRQTLVKNSLIFLVGFFGFLLGSYVSVGNIFKYFIGDEH